jgi:hypothetical protein
MIGQIGEAIYTYTNWDNWKITMEMEENIKMRM